MENYDGNIKNINFISKVSTITVFCEKNFCSEYLKKIPNSILILTLAWFNLTFSEWFVNFPNETKPMNLVIVFFMFNVQMFNIEKKNVAQQG